MADRPFTERERNIYLAKLSEQAERYDDMITYMKAIIDAALSDSEDDKKELTVEERNLLSVAYKNVIGARRQSWRIISSVEGKGGQDDALLTSIKEYRAKVEKELEATCSDIITLLDSKLIPNAPSTEGQVFYYKMKGDYCRYQCEFQTPPASPNTSSPPAPSEKAQESAASARDAYDSASKAASALPPTNPIRLGLALNFSVYYYEIGKDSSKACELAKQAFDDAMSELDSLTEDSSYRDSTLIMQLLRDNLTLWNEVPAELSGAAPEDPVPDVPSTSAEASKTVEANPETAA